MEPKTLNRRLSDGSSIDPIVIRRIVQNQGFRKIWERLYSQTPMFDDKFTTALLLLQESDFANPKFLYDAFIPPGKRVFDLHVKQLKESLALAMVQKGIIDVNSESASASVRDAQKEIVRYVNTDQIMSELREVLPIHVMGAIANIALFDQMSPENIAQMRSFTTRSLLRDYLGDIKVKRQISAINPVESYRLVPEKIFENADQASIQVVKSYYFRQFIGLFQEGEQQGFSALESIIAAEAPGLKRAFLEEIRNEFQQVSKITTPDEFKTEVDWVEKYMGLPFPNFSQKYALHEFKRTSRLLIDADTGSGKTAWAYVAMRAAGAKKVTIFGPALARKTWEKEVKNIFKEDRKPSIFLIKSRADLAKTEKIQQADFVYISTDFVSQALEEEPETTTGQAPKTIGLLKVLLIHTRQTDGVIIDEAEVIRNPQAKCTRFVTDLVNGMEEQMKIARQAALSEAEVQLPIVALTATPISGSLEDMDVIMGLLYPKRFALPASLSKNGAEKVLPRFSDLTVDPRLAYSVLMGERLIMQWSLDKNEDELKKREPELIRMELSPYEMILYNWILDQPMVEATKMNLLSDYTINPDHTRNQIISRGLAPNPLDIETKTVKLKELFAAWRSMNQRNGETSEPFSADWMAKYGEEALLVDCFFDRSLQYGIDSLVLDSGDEEMKRVWKLHDNLLPLPHGGYIPVSAKFKYIYDQIKAGYKDGQLRYKYFIISPHKKQGITRDIGDGITLDENDNDAWSVVEALHLLMGDIPVDTIKAVDGSVNFAEREKIAFCFGTDSHSHNIIIAIQEAMSVSMNWSMRSALKQSGILGLKVFFLNPGWDWRERKQARGRFIRPDLDPSITIDMGVFEAADTIDTGKSNLVRMKYLLTMMAFAGVELTQDERRFYDSTQSSRRVLRTETTLRSHLARNFFASYRGEGEDVLAQALSTETQGRFMAERLAESYFDEGNDRNKLVGNNARIVSETLLLNEPKKILSIGAGTCLVDRCLREQGYGGEVDNLDMNGEIMAIAKARYPQIGRTIVGNASRLTYGDKSTLIPDSSYDSVDCSMMLDLTKYLSRDGQLNPDIGSTERAQVLCEINRVLKENGTAVVTLPEGTFKQNPDAFIGFLNALRFFGFDLQETTGMAYATEIHPARKISVLITLRKVAEPNLEGIDPISLAFPSEAEYVISRQTERRKKRSVVGDYPIYNFRQFKVVNPLTGRTTDLSYNQVLQGEELLAVVKADLKTLDKESPIRGWWRRIIREIKEEYSCEYEEAEIIAAEVLRDSGLLMPSVWLNNIEAREIKLVLDKHIAEFQLTLIKYNRVHIYQREGGDSV